MIVPDVAVVFNALPSPRWYGPPVNLRRTVCMAYANLSCSRVWSAHADCPPWDAFRNNI